MLVYDQNGVEFDKEPVDVRELVEQGWSREAPKVAEAPKAEVVNVYKETVEAPAEDAPRRGRPSKFGSNE